MAGGGIINQETGLFTYSQNKKNTAKELLQVDEPTPLRSPIGVGAWSLREEGAARTPFLEGPLHVWA